MSLGVEWMKCRFENVPNLLRASTIDHRSAAQYGQYSAPMYSTSGFPFTVSGVPEMGLSGATAPLGPAPTLSSTVAGTDVSSLTTAAFDEAVLLAFAVGVWFSDFQTTRLTTITMTTSTLPPATKNLRWVSRRRSAACNCAMRCLAAS